MVHAGSGSGKCFYVTAPDSVRVTKVLRLLMLHPGTEQCNNSTEKRQWGLHWTAKEY
jgi:hypothetical protein